MALKCMTKINGVIYPAGADVPVGDKAVEVKTDKETVVVEEPKKRKQKVSKTAEE